MTMTHTVHIGEITCTIISDGTSPMTVEAVAARLPGATEAQVQATYEAIGYDLDTLENHINCMLIQTGNETVLMDVGFGRGRNEAYGQVFDALDEMGISREAIDKVIITHMHGDHILGLTDVEGKRNFPNATILFNEVEWAHYYTHKNASEDVLAMLASIAHQKATFSAGDKIAPGVTAVAAYGHTPGHTGLLIESNGESLLNLVDTLHRDIQFAHPEWSLSFDHDTSVSEPTRREWLAKAADEKQLVAWYHLRFPALGYVSRDGDAFSWTYAE